MSNYNAAPKRAQKSSDRPFSGGPKKGAKTSRPASIGRTHRGYSAAETESGPGKKKRWSPEQKQVRSSFETGRGARRGNDEKPERYDRSSSEHAPRGERFERAERSYRSNDGAPRTDRGNDRPARSFDRDDRAPRRFDRDDRAPRTFNRDDRPARSFNRDDRPARSFDRDDRAPRRFDRDDRPARSFDRNDRNDRPARNNEGGDSKFYPKRDSAEFYSHGDDVVLEKLEAKVITADESAQTQWSDLGLGNGIIEELQAMGAIAPFPIQSATVPMVLSGRDVLGRARTGSGKTIAFGAPLVELLLKQGVARDRKMGRKPRALILAPTRELALQIDNTVQPIARRVGLFTTQIYGGVPQARQVGALQRGVDIIVGTPGRIEDLVEQGRLDLSQVSITVLDEADHMCELGFLEPVQRILRLTQDGGQRLLFSATLDRGVAQLADEFLNDPTVHEVAGEDQASSTIEHKVYLVEHREKLDVIADTVQDYDKVLIFTRTRSFAEQLSEELIDMGIPATALHGDLNQAKRTRNLERFSNGRVQVLVATDVAARGIHVDDIPLVIQADAPDEYKTYLHRSGRTGRAGKEGLVITLTTKQRRRKLTELLKRAEIEAPFIEVAASNR
ncbi:MAG: DEAD/DEAH box helicase [Microbacteriaceae bacterium]